MSLMIDQCRERENHTYQASSTYFSQHFSSSAGFTFGRLKLRKVYYHNQAWLSVVIVQVVGEGGSSSSHPKPSHFSGSKSHVVPADMI